ncbi:MAG: hypothetical protein E4H05_07110 [Acidimicrobiales bacterium]|nr:MAG: hypothetical protein E4H05_07110 [Acidimicrobiales bacterium]
MAAASPRSSSPRRSATRTPPTSHRRISLPTGTPSPRRTATPSPRRSPTRQRCSSRHSPDPDCGCGCDLTESSLRSSQRDTGDVITVEDFQHDAATWLTANRADAPRDYGAICPPDLVEAGLGWQRRLTDAGWAGIHWPTEYGGQGPTPEHNGVWLLECARAGVPAVFNMVGFVLAGGAVMRYGTPDQQTQHLRATLAT